MKKIDTRDAIGSVLCHDVTQIIHAKKKDVLLKKGHVIRPEDIEPLLSIGKFQLYVWEQQEGMMHENDGAQALYEICGGENMHPTEVKEGKIEAISDTDGLLKVDVERLDKINAIDELMIATRHGNRTVKKGDKLAGMRVIPLVVEESKLIKAKEVAEGKPLLEILPFKPKKIGIITTGREVFTGLIKDSFGPVIVYKLNEYENVEIIGQKILSDEPAEITREILNFIDAGADAVICTGGMSVDPDDTTPSAIKNTGAEIITYGAPVLPGAMLLVSYYGGKIPIVGLPGCVMYGKRTIFDLILPRIMADDRISKQDLVKIGHGGLCLNCESCHFPNCGFGT